MYTIVSIDKYICICMYQLGERWPQALKEGGPGSLRFYVMVCAGEGSWSVKVRRVAGL